MSTILAIDPGSITTGYAWQEEGGIISGTISVKKSAPVPQRLKLIRTALCGIIESDEAPLYTAMVIEIPVAHAYKKRTGRDGKSMNVEALFILSRAIGVIQEAAVAHGIPVIEIRATEWTQGLKKDERPAAASAIKDQRVTQPDEADAICLLNWWQRTGRHI